MVGPGAIVGDGDDDTPNRREPTRLNTGITVIGKRSVIPRGARIGRNVRVAESVRSTDFTRRVVPTGGSVDRVGSRRATRLAARRRRWRRRRDRPPRSTGRRAPAAEAAGRAASPRLTDPGPAGDLADLG